MECATRNCDETAEVIYLATGKEYCLYHGNLKIKKDNQIFGKHWGVPENER